MVQGFFSYRLFLLLSFRWVAYMCWALALVRFGLSCGVTAVGFTVPSLVYFETKLAWLLTSLLVIGAFVDIAIAIALTSFLYSQKGMIRRCA
jgi:hypothetical protein